MRVLRRLSAYGWLPLVLALLGAVGLVTVQGVDRVTDQVQDERLADRVTFAEQASQPASAWLDDLRLDSGRLAAGLAKLAPRELRGAKLDPAPGHSALLVDAGLTVLAASSDRLGSIDLKVTQCAVQNEASDTTMGTLVQSGKATLSSLFRVPGPCTLGVAAVTPVAGRTLAVFADAGDLALRTGGRRVPCPDAGCTATSSKGFVVDPTGKSGVSSDGATVLSDPQQQFVAASASRAGAGRYSEGESSLIAAYTPLAEGWGFLLEEPATNFDIAVQKNPAILSTGILVGVAAAVVLLVAWFDVRRRKAARLAEVERNKFLAIVGHELRTPLTVIKGYTETLASRWDRLDDERRQMLIENLAPQTQRQARVIEHLLTAAALRAGTFTRPSIEPTDVGPVLERTAAEYQPVAPLHDIVVGSAAVPAVSGNAEVLGQVLSELVDNAVRFSPSGGAVRISASAARRTVEISVEDDGVGLPSDTGRLFLPFGQAEDVDNRLHAEGGIGVGLFIARSLVEMMGGQLRAERRQSDGARFVVSLPIARQNAVTAVRT